jgi:hypothetical protein
MLLQAKFAFRPGGYFCMPAWMKFSPAGLPENFTLRPGGISCIQDCQRAAFAFLKGAEFAPLVSAIFARDSIYYLINYSLTT